MKNFHQCISYILYYYKNLYIHLSVRNLIHLQSLAVTMVSYMGNLKVVLSGEKGFIDSQLLISCMKEAFDKIYREACGKDDM